MPVDYTVKQGDYLAAIAHQFGFADPDILWNDPANAALKQQRINPNVLYPGDTVVIPDLQTQELPRSTGARHSFVLNAKPLWLRIRLAQAFAKTLAKTPCEFTVGSTTSTLNANASAQLSSPCPPTVKSARVVAHTTVRLGKNAIPVDIQFDAKVGYLDPIDTPTGQLGRLSNLGYYLNFDPDNQVADLKSAIEEFQCDNHLSVDGICGPATQAKLKAIHGC